MPTQFVDGNTSLGVYEHGQRFIEIDGVPYGGWIEGTGGGIVRDGQTYVRGAGGKIRGKTNGNATPQESTMKWEPVSWLMVVQALTVKALSLGITGDDAHQKVPFNVVDQWAGVTLLQRSITTTTECTIKSEKPNTAPDGTPFDYEIVLMPNDLPTRTFGL